MVKMKNCVNVKKICFNKKTNYIVCFKTLIFFQFVFNTLYSLKYTAKLYVCALHISNRVQSSVSMKSRDYVVYDCLNLVVANSILARKPVHNFMDVV